LSRLLLPIAAASTCLAWAAPALAQGAENEAFDERARLHFQSGSSYFEAGEYERALQEFQTALELSGRPALHYNIYLAHERLGNLEEAVVSLERYIEAGEAGEQEAILERRLDNLRRRLERQRSEAPPPDEAPPDEAPPDEAPPDEHTAAAPGDTAPAPSDTGGVGAAPVVAFSIAGAGAIAWGVFGTLASLEYDRLDDECGPACSQGSVGDLEAYNTLGDIGFVVTMVGSAAGVLLLVLSGGDGERREATAGLSPWASPTGGGVSAGGTF